MILPMAPSPLLSLDLAARQHTLDHAATAHFPELYAAKVAKMAPAPHAFFRGSAPLFYELLAQRPELAEGPEGTGAIVGDMHLENIGAYRTDADTVVLDLNDFDDATIAPLRFDALRLATSALLAALAFPMPGAARRAVGAAVLDAHARALDGRGYATTPPRPVCLGRVVENATRRSKNDLLDQRAPKQNGKRGFVLGSRYLALPAPLQAEAPKLWARYVDALGDRISKRAGTWVVNDIALRVAGTGSLGRARLSFLVTTHDGEEQLFELKEALPSAVGRALPLPEFPGNEAERLVCHERALLREPPRKLAALSSEPLATSFVGRKLAPQEDKLDIATDEARRELEAVARYAGHLLGAAHARVLTSPPPGPWSGATGPLLDRAVELAGIFCSAYLAYSSS
jgi:uncharacterized protein (DUF2252 family)